MDSTIFVFECFPLDPFCEGIRVSYIIDFFTLNRDIYFSSLAAHPEGGGALSVVRGSWPSQNELALRRVTSDCL